MDDENLKCAEAQILIRKPVSHKPMLIYMKCWKLLMFDRKKQ